MATNTKLQRQAPAWHAQAAAELNRDFAEVEQLCLTAARRRAYLGLKLIAVKECGKADGSIPHGRFGAWLGEHCPEIPRRTVGDYMLEAKSAAERLGWQIGEFRHFETAPHRLIESQADDLKPAERKQQQLLLDLVDGKGKFRPVTRYQQVDDGADVGDGAVRRGRRKGEGGASKEQRARARELSESERLEWLQIRAAEVSEWLLEVADAKGIGMLEEPQFSGLLKALETAVSVARQTAKARGA